MSGPDIVRRYFAALDEGDTKAMPDLFALDSKTYRPELPEPLVGPEAMKLVVAMAGKIFSSFETTLIELIEDGDVIVARLRHDAVYRDKWRTRVGTFDVAGRPTSWEALALFRLRDGKIIEERVFRDELGMLLDVGALSA